MIIDLNLPRLIPMKVYYKTELHHVAPALLALDDCDLAEERVDEPTISTGGLEPKTTFRQIKDFVLPGEF